MRRPVVRDAVRRYRPASRNGGFPISTTSDLIRWARPHRGTLVRGGAALVATTSISSLGPWVLKEGIDSLGAAAPPHPIEHYALALVALAAVEGLFRYDMRRSLIGVSRRIEYDLRRALYAHVQRLPLARFHSFEIGDLMARSTNDLDAIRMAFGPGLMYTANTLLVLVVSLALMIHLSAELTLWAFAPLPFLSLAVARVMRLIHDRILRVQEGFADLTTHARESFAGIRVIKSFAREEILEAEFAAVNRELVERNLALARVQRVFFPAIGLFTGAALALVLGRGGLLVMSGALTIGEFVAFTGYLFLLMWPMAALGWTINLFHRGRASWGRVQEILALEREPLEPGEGPPARGGWLEFRGVTLRRGERAIVENVSFEVRPGETVALVGPTGSGKSSLLRLAPRLDAVETGAVLLDGVPVEEWNLAALREAIAFVPQEGFLFSDTIESNLALGAPGADRARVREAASRARILEEIEAFSRGFDSVLGERGITLSGGQRQRVTLARALLRDPRVLLLDDSFSSMDTRTEEEILDGLQDRLGERTVLLVSHRLSTIRRAERVVYLEEGRVVEAGTHEDLVRRAGAYARFVRRQQLLEELEREEGAASSGGAG